jgi:uncharacterized protein YbjT (DUF2867 family)
MPKKEKKVKAVLFGATGLAGSGVLEECLEHPQVEKLTIITRKKTGKKKHKKVNEVIHKDFLDYSKIKDELSDHNTCFYCLGISQGDVGNKKKYTRITYDFTMAAAEALIEANGEDNLTFCFLSGSGTDSTEKSWMMWARVKGKAENDLGNFAFKKLFNFRPGFIMPAHGQKQRYKMGYFIAPFYPLMNKLSNSLVLNTKEFGLAMINATLYGYSKRILENKDLKKLAAKGLKKNK